MAFRRRRLRHGEDEDGGLILSRDEVLSFDLTAVRAPFRAPTQAHLTKKWANFAFPPCLRNPARHGNYQAQPEGGDIRGGGRALAEGNENAVPGRRIHVEMTDSFSGARWTSRTRFKRKEEGQKGPYRGGTIGERRTPSPHPGGRRRGDLIFLPVVISQGEGRTRELAKAPTFDL